MTGLFITFEGTEGSGKSTQIALLAERLLKLSYPIRMLREPGGTPIGEEIRHTLQHSDHNDAMTAETELLLMNASRAQLVREVIRPALALGEIVLCDRFYDSTIAYQGYGRELNLAMVRTIINFAVGDIFPHLTLLLSIPLGMSKARQRRRELTTAPQRDRFEEADQNFFQRVEKGYEEIAATEPGRVKLIKGAQSIAEVSTAIWREVEPLLKVHR